jgi:hypothetical protein
MDDATIRGLAAVAIGIVLFLMGYARGSKSGVSAAVEHMFTAGLLATDKDGNIIAGPKLKDK